MLKSIGFSGLSFVKRKHPKSALIITRRININMNPKEFQGKRGTIIWQHLIQIKFRQIEIEFSLIYQEFNVNCDESCRINQKI